MIRCNPLHPTTPHAPKRPQRSYSAPIVSSFLLVSIISPLLWVGLLLRRGKWMTLRSLLGKCLRRSPRATPTLALDLSFSQDKTLRSQQHGHFPLESPTARTGHRRRLAHCLNYARRRPRSSSLLPRLPSNPVLAATPLVPSLLDQQVSLPDIRLIQKRVTY